MTDLIPNGTIVVALRNITYPDVWPPLIYGGDELRVLGYAADRTENGVPTAADAYRVETHRGLHVYVKPEDIEVKAQIPDKTVEQRIADAFREGYAQGHRRGLTCGRLYGADDTYIVEIQAAERAYIRELRGEDDY